MSEYKLRVLSNFEEKLIKRMLLENEFENSKALTKQLDGARVDQFETGDNYGSIEFFVTGDAAKITRPNPVTEMEAKDSDGKPFSALLHVRDGKLYMLEFLKPDGSPLIKRPAVSDFYVPAWNDNGNGVITREDT